MPPSFNQPMPAPPLVPSLQGRHEDTEPFRGEFSPVGMDCKVAEQGSSWGVSRSPVFLEHPGSGRASMPCVSWFNPSQKLHPSPSQQSATKYRVQHKVIACLK